MMDCNSQIRTCNRCSPSPAAITRVLDSGQRFAIWWVSSGSGARSGAAAGG
jgi:hypothetical protein